MALAGKTYEDIKIRALQMASKPTAMKYVEEVLRRVQSMQNK